MDRDIIALVFRCKVTGGDLTTTDEASAFRWAADTEIADFMDQAYAVRVLHTIGLLRLFTRLDGSATGNSSAAAAILKSCSDNGELCPAPLTSRPRSRPCPPRARKRGHVRRFTVSHGATGNAVDRRSRRPSGRGHYLASKGSARQKYSAGVQQRPLTTASQPYRQHTE
jgi:hypothetical protein